MRVLLVESDRRAADDAITELQAAGHRVVRCHEADLPAFPCNALCDKGSCPLETNESVDVVVDYRAHPYPRPTPFEDGVSCALRHHVPLVVAGTSALNPFDTWTTAIADDHGIVEACERAVTLPVPRLADAARAKVRERLHDQPDLATRTDVVVYRNGSQVDATIWLPEDAGEVDEKLAVAVVGALRAENQFASRVNVAVRRRIDD